jgi:polyketide biosynthesis acyl carrier protein
MGVSMDKQKIFDILVRHMREIVPDIGHREISFSDSLRALGANSIDRSEIIMATREELSLEMPLAAFARAESLGELAGIMQHGLASA